MMDVKRALEIISNVIECEIEYSEDADNLIYATELGIALKTVQDVVNNSLASTLGLIK